MFPSLKIINPKHSNLLTVVIVFSVYGFSSCKPPCQNTLGSMTYPDAAGGFTGFQNTF